MSEQPLHTVVVSPPGAKQVPGTSPAPTESRIKVGCLVALLIVFVLVIGSVGAGAWFAFRTGDGADVRSFVGAETVGVLRVEMDPGNTPLQQFLDEAWATLMVASDAHRGADLPPLLSAFRGLQDQRRADQFQQLKRYLPREVLLLSEPAQDGLELAVVAQPQRLPRVMRKGLLTVLGANGRHSAYKGHEYVILSEKGYAAFVGATALYAESLPVLQRLFDRNDAPRRHVPSPLLRELDAGEPGCVVRGVLRLERADVRERFDPEHQCDLLTGTVTMAGPDDAEVRAEFDCASESAATSAAGALADGMDELTSGLAEAGLEVSIDQGTATGRRAHATARVSGMMAALRVALNPAHRSSPAPQGE